MNSFLPYIAYLTECKFRKRKENVMMYAVSLLQQLVLPTFMEWVSILV